MIPYEEWPTDPQARRELARRIFGNELSRLHQSGVKLTEWLLEGNLLKKPAEDEVRLSEWAKTIAPDDKERVLELVAKVLESTLFSTLVLLDGDRAGSPIPPSVVRYELNMLVQPQGRDWWKSDKICLNAPEDQEMHEVFFEAVAGKWKENES